MIRPANARLALIVALVLLSTAACGTRWTAAQRAAVSRRTALAASNNPAATGSSATGADTGAAAGPSDTALGGTGASGAVGPTGAKTATGNKAVSASANKPCAAPSTAPGLTASQITVGSISSLSGPVPGLSATSAAAARSYVAYMNSKGGVCGRSIVLKEADDGTDNSKYRTIVSDLGPKIFGLVGGFAIGDVGGADLVEAQKLPGIDLPSADSSSNVSTIFDINPPYKNLNAVLGKYAYLKAHGATKASVVYIDTDQSRLEAKNQISLIKAAGIQVVNEQPLPLSTLSYDSAARSVANSGADYMLFIGTTDADVSMAQSLQDTGYKLKWPEYFTFAYATNFAQLAGSAGEGAITWLRWLPNEEASANPELARFLEWMERTAPGEPKDAFAADSWASAKAFFDTLANLPGPITRESFVNQVKATKSFDADGMFGAIELGAERSNSCVVGMQVVGGKWKRMTPAAGFVC